MSMEQSLLPVTDDVQWAGWVWDDRRGMLIHIRDIPTLQPSGLLPGVMKTWKRGTWS